MPSLKDREFVIRAFDNDCIWPHGSPRLEDAWLGIYQMLLWYVHGYIHIREANDLAKNRTWQRRATEAEAYIAGALNLLPANLPAHVDRMMQLPRWRDVVQGKGIPVICPHCGTEFEVPKEGQRNNPLGNGLRILTAEILRRWSDDRFSYEEEVRAINLFPGIHMGGRTKDPKIDVVARSRNRVRVIVSCKWSGRHDRMADVTNECREYKAAAIRLDITDLQHFVITNELDGQRTDKILNQECISGLVMVHLPLAQVMGTTTPMMKLGIASGRLLDLTDFVKLTHTWTE
jgi:hypothetical protein